MPFYVPRHPRLEAVEFADGRLILRIGDQLAFSARDMFEMLFEPEADGRRNGKRPGKVARRKPGAARKKKTRSRSQPAGGLA